MKIYWQKKRDKLKQKYAIINGRDLKYKIGKEIEMVKRLKDKLGKSEEEILSILIDL